MICLILIQNLTQKPFWLKWFKSIVKLFESFESKLTIWFNLTALQTACYANILNIYKSNSNNLTQNTEEPPQQNATMVDKPRNKRSPSRKLADYVGEPVSKAFQAAKETVYVAEQFFLQPPSYFCSEFLKIKVLWFFIWALLVWTYLYLTL